MNTFKIVTKLYSNLIVRCVANRSRENITCKNIHTAHNIQASLMQILSQNILVETTVARLTQTHVRDLSSHAVFVGKSFITRGARFSLRNLLGLVTLLKPTQFALQH